MRRLACVCLLLLFSGFASAQSVVSDSDNQFWTVGASKVFNKYFTEDFYYMRQNDGVSVPGDLNVIGTSLRFRL